MDIFRNIPGNSGGVLPAPKPELMRRVLNSVARMDLKKQGKFWVNAGAPRAKRPKITAAFFKRNAPRASISIGASKDLPYTQEHIWILRREGLARGQMAMVT